MLTTRAAYDAGADRYVEWVGSEISAAMEAPIDRSLLASFAAVVRDRRSGTVVDVGCGPGRAAAFLAARGIDAVGIDVSREMLLAGSVAHPSIPLAQATLAVLPFRDSSLAAVVSWYSIIHTPPPLLGRVWAEFGRVLATGGHLLVAFQAGQGEEHRRDEAFGRPVSLTSYRHVPIDVEHSLVEVGFDVQRHVEREPALPHETTRQAFIVAQLDVPK